MIIVNIFISVSGKPLLKNVKSSFLNGDITFTWNVSTNDPSSLLRIEYNGSWINLNDTRHVVKDAFLYKIITIDVTESVPNEYYRWAYTGKGFSFQKIKSILWKLNQNILIKIYAFKKTQYNYCSIIFTLKIHIF